MPLPRKIDAETTPARAALMTRQGAAIRAARLARGLSQRGAAAALGVTLARLRAWEIGRRACPLGLRQRMAAAWGADPGALDAVAEYCPHCGRPYPVAAHSTRPATRG